MFGTIGALTVIACVLSAVYPIPATLYFFGWCGGSTATVFVIIMSGRAAKLHEEES